jgi:hydroxymethylpyrimidine pyrophosphatase-like HAD family hydrolase
MTLIASDLDRTLIFSVGFVSNWPTSTPLREVELYQGRNISMMAEEVRQKLPQLARQVTLVPTTTRTRAQLRRLDLGFTARYEVCSSGATILEHDQRDAEWDATVRSLVAAECMSYDEAAAGFDSSIGKGWMRQLRDAEGVFLIASVNSSDLPPEEVEALTETFVAGNWRVVHQGSKVYALPRVITKSAAAAHLTRRLGLSSDDVWAAGDSVLDWDMLAHAGRAWTAVDGELAGTGRTAPHLSVTAAHGVDSSVEIVRAWCELAGLC